AGGAGQQAGGQPRPEPFSSFAFSGGPIGGAGSGGAAGAGARRPVSAGGGGGAGGGAGVGGPGGDRVGPMQAQAGSQAWQPVRPLGQRQHYQQQGQPGRQQQQQQQWEQAPGIMRFQKTHK
ncbi:hypothetical protein MNEG_14760, partial [Monoraphidium neglectum]